MKNSLIYLLSILITVFIAACGESQTERDQLTVVQTWYEGSDSLLKEKYTVLSDSESVRHGMYRMFYRNGKVSAEYEYANGVLDGDFREYHQDGSLWLEYHYAGGKPDGAFSWYHPNGEIHMKGRYDEGVYADTLWEYNQAGALISRQTEFSSFAMDE